MIEANQDNSEATCESRESLETNMSNIPKEKAAYYAGFFDADGYIGAFSQDRLTGNPSYGCEVKLGAKVNHKKTILRELFSQFGGRVHGDETIHLSFRIEEAERFLKTLYPFLILKKPQAALWFKLRQVIKQKIEHGYRHDLRTKLVDKINSMHNSEQGPLGKPRPDWKPSETIAYTAGLIDGDGSIGRNKYGCLTIRLSGKPKTLPEWLQNVNNGTLRSGFNQQRNCNYWEWAVYAANAEKVLVNIKNQSLRAMMIESDLVSNYKSF